MKIEKTNCSTAKKYIEELSLSNNQWWHDSKMPYIFRGQNNNLSLTPTIFRSFVQPIQCDRASIQQIKNIIKNSIERMNNGSFHYVLTEKEEYNLLEILKTRIIEYWMIEQFLLKCNEIRLYVPTIHVHLIPFSVRGSFTDSLNTYLEIFTEKFLRKYFNQKNYTGSKNGYNLIPTNGIEVPLETLIEAIALSRHHGILSSFLDFTRDPLYAAFFSAYNLEKATKKICVYSIDTRYIGSDFGSGEMTIHNKLKHNGLEFLHVQRGLFLEMNGCDSYYLNHGKWPSIDEYLMDREINDFQNINNVIIRKIELPAKEVTSLIEILDEMGINKHTLMPTYDNVAYDVNSMFKKDKIGCGFPKTLF